MNFKTSLFLLLAIGSLSKTNAQELPIRFGLKFGGNYSVFSATLKPPALDHFTNDGGFYAGGQVVIRVTKHFSLQPEIFYIESREQNYTYDSYGGVYNENSDELRHISIPVLAKFRVGKFALYAGTQISYLLSADVHSGTQHYTISVTDSSYKKINFSGVAGLEYIFKQRFGIDARYQFGFSNICAANGITLMTDYDKTKIKLGGLQVGVFYRFGRRK